jgi:HlyD family secretion protein
MVVFPYHQHAVRGFSAPWRKGTGNVSTPDETLFTPAALQALHAAKSTDSIAGIISHWMWFFLFALTLAAGAVVYWGFLGVMVDSVTGVGVTVRSGGIDAIVARGPGIIENLNIAPGTTVIRNDIVGQLYNAEKLFNLSKTDIEYKYIKLYLEALRSGTDKITQDSLSANLEKEKELLMTMSQIRKGIERSYEINTMYEKLTKTNSASKIDYYNALERWGEAQTRLSGILQQSIDSNLLRSSLEWQNRQTHLSAENQQRMKEQEAALAFKLFKESIWIRSANEGTVIEVLKDVGDRVELGDHIAIVSASKSSELSVVGFVPMEEGKKVKAGMSVFFAPSSFKPKDYGYIRGVVRETSPFPVSSESIAAELKNKDMAQSIGGKRVQMRITVELLPDRNAPSFFKWTTKKGAPAPLEPGSLGQLIINTAQRAPVSYIVPYFREKALGIGKTRAARTSGTQE